jgi:hypothetical protein
VPSDSTATCRRHLPQEPLALVVVHLLERLGGELVVERAEQATAMIAAEVLERIGELRERNPACAPARRTGAPGTSSGWITAQSMTRVGVGIDRQRRGPSRRSSVRRPTSTPTRRTASPTVAR